MSLEPGTSVGHYRIASKIGSGGMGDVYRAHDSRLDREVAIKLLPGDFSRDDDRLRRFEQEARATSALNHPNILTVYDIGEHEGAPFIVAELLEGEELRRRLDEGPIPLRKVTDYARQIVTGLSAAHEKGIVHRDLKPENLFITADDRVKILDFGLAKLNEPSPSGRGSDDATRRALTSPGVVMGTAGYMSPEQVRGSAIDHRSDIFSFGVILYEMLTGRKAFHGDSMVELMNAILKEEVPEWDDEDRKVPLALDKIMRRCLDKQPAHRFHSAHDLGFALEALSIPTASGSGRSAVLERPDSGSAPALAGNRQRFWQIVAAVSTTFAIAIGITAWTWRSKPARRGQALAFSPLSFEQGGQCCAVWSPDGKAVAFAAAENKASALQIYVRYLDSQVPRQVTRLPADGSPIQWTTAGKIIFEAPSTGPALWSVSPVGGKPERFLDLAQMTFRATAVSRDGSTVAVFRPDQDGVFRVWIGSPPGSELRRYDPSPFEAASLTNVPRMEFSPDGQQLVLFRNAAGGSGEEAWVLPVPANAANPPRRVLADLRLASSTAGVSWMPDNRRVLLSAATGDEPPHLLLADTISGTADVLLNTTKANTQPAVSPDGAMVAFREVTRDYDIVSIDLATGAVKPLIATQRSEYHPMWSPKASAMAYVTDRNGEREIWLHQPGQPDRPLVTPRDFPPDTTASFLAPSLSPDGSRLIYTRWARGAGHVQLWISAVTGGPPVRVLTGDAPRQELPGSWSPDGHWFVYWAYEGGRHSLNKVKTTGMATPEVIASGIGSTSLVPTWSPSGEWILISRDARLEILSPDGKASRQLPGDSWLGATFSSDGKLVHAIQYANSRLELVSFGIAGGAVKTPHSLDIKDMPGGPGSPTMRLSLTPDGKSLSYTTLKSDAVLWLMTGLGPPGR